MADAAFALTQRELIQDAAVIEELDRTYARLNAFLRGIGQADAEADLNDGIDQGGGVSITSFAQLNGPLILPVKVTDINSDFDSFDPEDRTVIRLTPTGAARTINGIRGGSDGRILKLYVPLSAAQTLTLAHNASAADPDKRIHLVGAADLVTVAGQPRGIELVYDGTDRVWTQMGGSASIAAAPKGLQAVVEGHTQVGTDADTAEKDLVTGTLPADTLDTDGDVLIVRAYGNFANNAQGKRLRFYWNGTVVADTAAQAWQDQGWQLYVVLTRTGGSAQKGHAQFIPAIAGTSPQPGDFFSDTADLTSTVAFKITGQNSSATANDIVFEGWTAYKVQAP